MAAPSGLTATGHDSARAVTENGNEWLQNSPARSVQARREYSASRDRFPAPVTQIALQRRSVRTHRMSTNPACNRHLLATERFANHRITASDSDSGEVVNWLLALVTGRRTTDTELSLNFRLYRGFGRVDLVPNGLTRLETIGTVPQFRVPYAGTASISARRAECFRRDTDDHRTATSTVGDARRSKTQ